MNNNKKKLYFALYYSLTLKDKLQLFFSGDGLIMNIFLNQSYMLQFSNFHRNVLPAVEIP